MKRSPRRRAGSAIAAAIGALALLALFASSALASEPATFRLLGSAPIYSSVQLHKADGGTVNVRPARYHYRITTASGVTEASGNCVDLSHYITTGRDYQVNLESAADDPALGNPSFRAAGWLLSKADDLIGAADDPALEAGALQVAVWQLSGQARDLDAPSSDPALNARVAELRAAAAGRSVPSALAVSVAGGDTCLATPAAVTVTGTPGAVVDLAVTAGTGTISPARVTLDENGVAPAQLSSDVAGQVTVSATTSAPLLLRATKTPGQTTPQDQLFLRPRTLTETATHGFKDCGVVVFGPTGPGLVVAPPPVAPPPVAPAPVAPAEPPLAISLASPRLAAPGGAAVYRLRVTNNGPRTARGVTVAQKVGSGLVPVKATGPRGTRSGVRRHAARWKVSALRAGRTATLTLKVRVARRLAGGISHSTASARGSGSARAKDSGSTAIVRKVGKIEQGF